MEGLSLCYFFGLELSSLLMFHRSSVVTCFSSHCFRTRLQVKETRIGPVLYSSLEDEKKTLNYIKYIYSWPIWVNLFLSLIQCIWEQQGREFSPAKSQWCSSLLNGGTDHWDVNCLTITPSAFLSALPLLFSFLNAVPPLSFMCSGTLLLPLLCLHFTVLLVFLHGFFLIVAIVSSIIIFSCK